MAAESIPPAQGPRATRRTRALDPFFLFTYALLALVGLLQLFLIFWMDLF